ncbi:nodulation protein NopA [Bradyrhizobium erythrophlei]|uniref:nodulation protein NopA n=1 Tax=Bradyrhizobium erythrophlei TaxID=1437360 RepID=UPI0035EE612A
MATQSVHGGTIQIAWRNDMPGKVGASGAGAAGGAASTAGNTIVAAGAEAAGNAEFQKQLAALTAVTEEAAEKSVTTRIVTTQLQSMKKVADERVQ